MKTYGTLTDTQRIRRPLELYIAEQKQQIADLQRQNKLLRAVWYKFRDAKVKRTDYAMRMVWLGLEDYSAVLKAWNDAETAIDGGALGDG